MRPEYLTLFLVVGAGVYLTRFLPLLVATRREETVESEARPSVWLRFVGPSIIAALLVAPVLPEPGAWTELARALISLVPTIVVAARFKNLGLTVLVGILAYWLVSMAG